MTAWIDEAIRRERIALIEVWWDSQQRLWVTVSKDEDGNQIGDADWNAHKRDAVAAAKQRQIDEYTRKRHRVARNKPSLKIGTRAGGLPDENQVARKYKQGPALLMKRFKFGPS